VRTAIPRLEGKDIGNAEISISTWAADRRQGGPYWDRGAALASGGAETQQPAAVLETHAAQGKMGRSPPHLGPLSIFRD
jgi:hypothetical protein